MLIYQIIKKMFQGSFRSIAVLVNVKLVSRLATILLNIDLNVTIYYICMLINISHFESALVCVCVHLIFVQISIIIGEVQS